MNLKKVMILSWIEELSQIYDENKQFVGYEPETLSILLPIYHSTANAQIEITIDQNGNFIRANKIDKENAITIIPVTMDSVSRSSGIAPHPLCDKLIYIAGDYASYVSEGEKGQDFYEAHMTQLAQWQESPYTHPKVDAIYHYLKKSSLIRDLVGDGLFEQKENSSLLSDLKIETTTQSDCFIRFRVEGAGEETRTWRDETLFQCFADYTESLHQEKRLCYVSGRELPYTEKHPAKIRNTGDKAKIISANDESGFSYRGRFLTKDQFCTVGYEISEKAHDALKWLIQRQGWHKGSYAIVNWERHLATLPPIIKDTIDLFANFDDEETKEYPKTGEAFADELKKSINGYRANLSQASKITVMGLDSPVAGKGRLSIVMYRELSGSRFLNNIEKWHSDMAWYFIITKNKKQKTAILAPSPDRIAAAVYGTEQNGKVSAKEEIVKQTVDRLLPCIIDGKPIPKDIIRQAVTKASFPQSYEKWYNWQEILNIACALIKKELLEKKEDCPMALDTKSTDRSYLYGRLLGVADAAERRTFENGEDRQTNAKRYMSAFAAKPFTTWKIIEERLQPYLEKTTPGSKKFYSNLLNEIADLFPSIEEFANDKKLDGKYLLGYHCQTSALYKNHNKNEEEK